MLASACVPAHACQRVWVPVHVCQGVPAGAKANRARHLGLAVRLAYPLGHDQLALQRLERRLQACARLRQLVLRRLVPAGQVGRRGDYRARAAAAATAGHHGDPFGISADSAASAAPAAARAARVTARGVSCGVSCCASKPRLERRRHFGHLRTQRRRLLSRQLQFRLSLVIGRMGTRLGTQPAPATQTGAECKPRRAHPRTHRVACTRAAAQTHADEQSRVSMQGGSTGHVVGHHRAQG